MSNSEQALKKTIEFIDKQCDTLSLLEYVELLGMLITDLEMKLDAARFDLEKQG